MQRTLGKTVRTQNEQESGPSPVNCEKAQYYRHMAFDELREDYQGTPFHKASCAADPNQQFQRWFDDATAAKVAMANAMTLATVDEQGNPKARIVLLKELDSRGYVFFTNYQSRKGGELAHNNRATLLFYWHAMHRQIRIEGVVTKITAEESDAYFHTRPRASSLVAMASAQSRVVADRQTLVAGIAAQVQESGEDAIERPAHWGGYRLVPTCFEFWQGRPDRSHDRLEYQQDKSGAWALQRLYP